MNERALLIVEAPGCETSRASRQARLAGFRVRSTNCGRLAVSVASRLQPDVVLISPQPSRARLSEIARSIKENPSTTDIPVVTLTEEEHPARFSSRVYPTEACLSVSDSEQTLVRTLNLLTAAGRRRRRPSPTEEAPLEGNLEEDFFPDLLQFLFVARKSGCVTVTCRAQRGRLYLEDGNVVDAVLGDHLGADAFKRACFMTRGRFRWDPNRTTTRRTMDERGLDLLLEAAREKDEHEREYAAGSTMTPRVAFRKGPPGRACARKVFRSARRTHDGSHARPRRRFLRATVVAVALSGLFGVAHHEGAARFAHVSEESLADLPSARDARGSDAATPTEIDSGSDRTGSSEPVRTEVRAGM